MGLADGAVRISSREARHFAEGIPVAQAIGILVLNHHNCLAFAGHSGVESGGNVVNGLQVRRHQRFAIRAGVPKTGQESARRAEREFGIGIGHNALRHFVRLEVTQRNNASHHRRQRRRYLGVAHVCDVRFAVDGKRVDLRAECLTDLTRGAGEIQHHIIRIDVADGEAVRFEPPLNYNNVRSPHTVVRADLLRGQPFMEIGRVPVVQLIDHGFERLLPFGSALQQEKHVVDSGGVAQPATVVHRVRLRTRVAVKRHPALLVDAGCNEGPDRILCHAKRGKHRQSGRSGQP